MAKCAHQWKQVKHWSEGTWQCSVCKEEIWPALDLRGRKKVMIAPDLPPRGGQSGTVVGSTEIGGLIIRFSDQSEEEFPSIALYETKRKTR